MLYDDVIVEVERYVNQTYNLTVGLGDFFDDQEVTIRVTIHNKISEKEFEYYVSYDIKDEKIISTCCINQKSLNKEELDLAHTFIDLLNQEIIKTAKFMSEIY